MNGKGKVCGKASPLAEQLKKDYETLWKTSAKANFCKRQISKSKTKEWILERDKCGDPAIPCVEISDKLCEGTPLLFVGMNPSGADKKYYRGKKEDVLIYTGCSSYYKAMVEFTKECLGNGHDFSELDLFGIVQGTQSVVEKDFLENPDYYKEMFGLFLKYVVNVQPDVIFVANALASKILRRDKSLKLHQPKYDNFYKGTKYNLTQNDRFGGHTFTIGKFTCQIYFSSMLSGQHALDKGSREDLAWLVKNYINHL